MPQMTWRSSSGILLKSAERHRTAAGIRLINSSIQVSQARSTHLPGLSITPPFAENFLPLSQDNTVLYSFKLISIPVHVWDFPALASTMVAAYQVLVISLETALRLKIPPHDFPSKLTSLVAYGMASANALVAGICLTHCPNQELLSWQVLTQA